MLAPYKNLFLLRIDLFFVKDSDERTPLVNDEVMGTTEAPSAPYPPPVVGYISGHHQGTIIYLLLAAKSLTNMFESCCISVVKFTYP